MKATVDRAASKRAARAPLTGFALVAVLWLGAVHCAKAVDDPGATYDGDGGVLDADAGAPVSAPDAVNDASVDAGKDARPVGGPKCVAEDGGDFFAFDKRCGSTNGCNVVLHQIDCCGSEIAIGIGIAQVSKFNEAENAWREGCATCDCDALPTSAEDDTTGDAPTVTCDLSTEPGTCRSSNP